MRVFPHGHLSYAILPDIRLMLLVATIFSCAGLVVSVLRSRYSESQRLAHLDALRAQHPATRAMARGKLVEVLAVVVLFGEKRPRPRGACPPCSASSRFRAKTVLTVRVSQTYAAALSTLWAFLPPSTRLHLQTRATATLLALQGRTCTGTSGRSSRSSCTR
jgi:hypothetical protein